MVNKPIIKYEVSKYQDHWRLYIITETYDATYAKLRIVAMKNLPLYSIIKIKNYDGRDIFAIVLDRGVGSGVIDLLVENEKQQVN